MLPFEKSTREKVIYVMSFVNKHVLPNLFGISFGKGKNDWKQNLIRLSQAAMIAITFRILKKIFSRKAKKSSAN